MSTDTFVFNFMDTFFKFMGVFFFKFMARKWAFMGTKWKPICWNRGTSKMAFVKSLHKHDCLWSFCENVMNKFSNACSFVSVFAAHMAMGRLQIDQQKEFQYGEKFYHANLNFCCLYFFFFHRPAHEKKILLTLFEFMDTTLDSVRVWSIRLDLSSGQLTATCSDTCSDSVALHHIWSVHAW